LLNVVIAWQEARHSWTRLLRFLVCSALVAGCTDSGSPSTEPPVVTIASPVAGQKYAGGNLIQVSASAMDIRGAALASSQLEWWVLFHHATHTHPFLPATAGANATFTIPREGELASDVFYRVYVRAVNDRNLADTTFVDLEPRLTTLTVVTEPAGLSVTLDDQPRVTPVTVPSVVGMKWRIGVPVGQSQGGTEYEFESWSQGGAASQTIETTTAPLTLTAKLRDVGIANVPPSVSITSPASGTVVTAGTATTLTASAADANGSISLVEFFVGSTRVGQDASAPFTADWTPAGTGQRTITARATDNRGAYTVSAPVTVTVQTASGSDRLAPTASLTAPAEGTRDLNGSVSLTATASDNVGVTAVDFTIDGFALSTDDTAPYTATVSSTAAFASGAHTFGARAHDAAGNVSDWSYATVTFAGTVSVPAGFTLTRYVSGFATVPTAAVIAPDGRIFVCEQSGHLRLVKNGALVAQLVISLAVKSDGESGLVGVTLHPDFATNHFIYLYYTTTIGGPHNRIVRYTLNGDVADPASEVVLAELPPIDAPKHNGGAMSFGGDGKLYVAVGDNEVGANAPLLTTPFGKMLRLNADGSIPTDNPFYSQTTGINRSIWARGLRNPFTFVIEPGTGRMLINDVGNSTWEEINVGRPGADYGWPGSEGPTTNPAYDAPLLAIRHQDSPTLFEATAVVGAAFYHPATPSFGAEYVGSYFFADYAYSWVYRLDMESGKASAFAKVSGFITGLLVMPDGSLLVLNGTSIDRIGHP
jgi:glucose/arabinose dehydrogenase